MTKEFQQSLKELETRMIERFEQRFNNQEKQFEKRFDEQEKKFEKRFDEQEKKFEKRFDEQEKQFEKRFDELKEMIIDLNNQIMIINNQLNKKS